jgi:quercetin dioxygenase-like cupin family protein
MSQTIVPNNVQNTGGPMKKMLIAIALTASLAAAQDAARTDEAKKSKSKTEMKSQGHSQNHKMEGHKMTSSQNLQWQAGPASLPAGAQMVILEGNPKEAGPFTLRLKMPAGYQIKPHSHPSVEHVTVLSGEANFGMGNTWDESKGMKLSAGDFIYMQPGQTHYAWTTAETVIQLHGTGPWKVNYVNPADDPSRK